MLPICTIQLPYFSSERACVLSKELGDQTDFNILSCEQEQGLQKTRVLGASVIWPVDSVQVVQNNESRRNFFISGIGLESTGDFVDHLIEPDLPYRYLVLDVYALDQDTLMAIGLYLNSLPDSREDHESGVFIAKIDRHYNLVDYGLIGTEYTGSSITVQGHLDDDGYVIVGCWVLDKQDYIDTGLTRGYSVAMKIDPSSYDIMWETPLDSTVFRNWGSSITKFENSHQGDGYVYVGRGRERPTGGASSLLYGKMSKDGEQLWHHEFFDPYAPTSIDAVDVLATSDGHYTLTGFRVDRGDGDGFTTLAQLILMKFDEDGNVIEMTTSTEDKETASFAVVPNPAQDEVTIQTGISHEKQVYVVDMAGQLVLSETCPTADCTLDISEIGTGSYTVLLSDSKGEMLGRTSLVIQR